MHQPLLNLLPVLSLLGLLPLCQPGCRVGLLLLLHCRRLVGASILPWSTDIWGARWLQGDRKRLSLRVLRRKQRGRRHDRKREQDRANHRSAALP